MSDMTLSTERLDYTFDERGVLTGFRERATGIDLAKPGSYAFYLLPGVAVKPYPEAVPPAEVIYAQNVLTVRFPTVCFNLLVQCFAGHLRFTVIDQQPLGVDYGRFVFGGAVLRDDPATSFSGTAISLHLRCNLLELPGRSEQLGALAYAKLGAAGVSAAIAGAKFEDLRAILKQAIAHLSIDDIPMNPYGGPYGAEAPGARDDYVQASKIPDISDERWLTPTLKMGISQVDFIHGYLYRHADYRFRPDLFPRGVLDFKIKVSDVLHAHNCLAGLHSYSGMVDVRSSFVSPVPDPDLDSLAIYTLAEDLDAQSDWLTIEENAAQVPLYQTTYAKKEVTCLLIGHEIISFSGHDDAHRLTGCRRGHLGTTAQTHKKGEKLRHLRSMYNMFQCTPGSALFYKLAMNKAQTYNEGGFDMMYFDGLECIGACCTGDLEGLGWHYEALFVRETLRHCVRTPLVEYSTLHPLLWTARSRAGAFDYPTSAYKRFIDLHCADNEARSHRRLLPSQLGWLHLYPAATPYSGEPGDNWVSKYSYSDDIEYICSKAVAYSSGLSFILITPELSGRYPVISRYAEQIARYAHLRSGGYFEPAICERLKEPSQGWRLINEGGRFGFEQLTRLIAQPYRLDEPDNVTVENPFSAQKPVIRLEAQAAAMDDEGTVIWQFDPDLPVHPPLVREFPGSLDISGKEALILTLSSDGVAGKLKLRLETRKQYIGFGDHVIDLGFSGTRSFMLCENDNGEWDDLDWQGDQKTGHDYYSRYRSPVYYDGIGSIRVLRAGGGDIHLHQLSSHAVDRSPVRRPALTIGGGTVTFDCSLLPGQYLEYVPDDAQAKLFDAHGEQGSVPAEGMIGLLATGEANLTLQAEAYGNRRLKLHLLVSGERLFNN